MTGQQVETAVVQTGDIESPLSFPFRNTGAGSAVVSMFGSVTQN